MGKVKAKPGEMWEISVEGGEIRRNYMEPPTSMVTGISKCTGHRMRCPAGITPTGHLEKEASVVAVVSSTTEKIIAWSVDYLRKGEARGECISPMRRAAAIARDNGHPDTSHVESSSIGG